MLFFYTDFGSQGPYLGQMEAVIRQIHPTVPVIHLLSNAPTAHPEHSSYLLAALSRQLPAGSVLLCVVDPGVGGDRYPVVMQADGRWFVGPDNGLFDVVALTSQSSQWWIIEWRPERLSASFHGRDLFAPIAARIASHDWNWPKRAYPGPDLHQTPADIYEIIYTDHYGNLVSGLRYRADHAGHILHLKHHRIPQARTFGDVPKASLFWYQNSMNLVEIAANRARADTLLEAQAGEVFSLEKDGRG